MPGKVEASHSALAAALQDFFTRHPRAKLLEDGQTLFDMESAAYSISSDHGRCVLHLWSEERNLIRTVEGIQPRQHGLRVIIRRMGSSRPQSLYLMPDGGGLSTQTRASARKKYLVQLSRILNRDFPEYKLQSMRSSTDLENSFGPEYARGTLVQGQSCWAVIGVNPEESASSIDGVLTLGILWLNLVREQKSNRVCRGVKIFVPAGKSGVTRARMAWLNREIAQWELYEVLGDTEESRRIDISQEGNLEMRFVHCFDRNAAIERAQSGIQRILNLLPERMRDLVQVEAIHPGEVALSLHGLEFARVRQGFAQESFAPSEILTFRAKGNETPLREDTEALFQEMAAQIFQGRYAGGNLRDEYFRLQPERWLQSTLIAALESIELALRGSPIYSQVPAFSGRDRGILDLLTVTKGGRLAILELKASEDLHMPLQGLDYWIRVHRLQEQAGPEENSWKRNGYFPGIVLSGQSPLLYFVVPSLHVHPATEIVLQHLSPKILMEVNRSQ